MVGFEYFNAESLHAVGYSIERTMQEMGRQLTHAFLLTGIVADNDNAACRLLAQSGTDLLLLAELGKVQNLELDKVQPSLSLVKPIFVAAIGKAQELGHGKVTTETLLWALLEENDSEVVQLLENSHTDIEQLKEVANGRVHR